MTKKGGSRSEKSADLGRFVECPGMSLLSLFLSGRTARPDTAVLPRSTSKVPWPFKRCLAFLVSFVFLAAFVADVTDAFTGGGFRETAFGKSNPLISLVSFCSSQIGFFMAYSSALFLLWRREEILRCADVLSRLVVSFELRAGSIRSQLLRLRGYFYFVMIMAVTRFILAVGNRGIRDGFWVAGSYALLTAPSGLVMLYCHGTMLLSVLFYYPAMILFTYVSAVLVGCTEKFHEDNLTVLEQLSSPHEDVRMSGEKFVAHLLLMASRLDEIHAALNQLESTFGKKLLLDVAGNVAVTMSGIAWFAVNAADPAPTETFFRHLLADCIYLATVWILVSQPIALYHEHKRMIEIMEKTVYQRQINTIGEPSREESVLISSLLFRVKDKNLTILAGGILELNPFLFGTILAGMAGFAGFVMERAQTFTDNHAVAVKPPCIPKAATLLLNITALHYGT